MKQIYIPPVVSILIVLAISVGVTLLIMHEIAQVNFAYAETETGGV
jgi:hypothetical protein